MLRTKRVMDIVGVILLSAGITWAGPNMNPGTWEIITKMEMPGMPGQSVTHTQCITEQDLVPVNKDPNNSCTVKNISTRGNTVSWEITCGGQGGEMDGTGEITYAGDTMKGNMVMVMKAMNMTITNTLSGKRIGPCDGASY
nr:DUF3617 domain-containing protein [uncultured Desulfobacter sp.]